MLRIRAAREAVARQVVLWSLEGTWLFLEGVRSGGMSGTCGAFFPTGYDHRRGPCARLVRANARRGCPPGFHRSDSLPGPCVTVGTHGCPLPDGAECKLCVSLLVPTCILVLFCPEGSWIHSSEENCVIGTFLLGFISEK